MTSEGRATVLGQSHTGGVAAGSQISWKKLTF